MATKSTPDIVFSCPLCRGSLVTHSGAVGHSVTCAHCRETIVVPLAPAVTDATLAPGVRRVNTRIKKEEVLNPLAAELATMTLLYSETRAQLAAVREELHQTRLQEEQANVQIDARIRDLQRQLDRVINRLAASPKQPRV
ncbi:MAG: hypothetical protein JWL90_3107 [Chthoniobacteraceae bacterium]|nr:hypothetical protein [Chthoniobacteraceae bacterium]